MSEKKTPDPTISEEKDVKSSPDTTKKDVGSKLPSKAPETMMDVFKKFAVVGTNWADIMIEEASQAEEAERKIRLDAINKEITGFKKPFVIYVKYNSDATAEDLYFLFGGNSGKVDEIYLYDEGKTGNALIELSQLEFLADALMKNETEFFKEKLSIEYVDVNYHKCFTIPQPKPTAPQQPKQVVPQQPKQVVPQQPKQMGSQQPKLARPPPVVPKPNREGQAYRHEFVPESTNNRMDNNGQFRKAPVRGGLQNKPYDSRGPNRQPQSNDVRNQTGSARNQMGSGPHPIPSLFSSINDDNKVITQSHGLSNTNDRRQNEDRQYDNRQNDNRFNNRRQNDRRPNDNRFNDNQPGGHREFEKRPIEKKPTEENPAEIKPSAPKVPKISPFGNAVANDRTAERMIQFATKVDEMNASKVPQKKKSVSSQHSQQLSEDQHSEDRKSNFAEPKLPESTNEQSEKKPYHSITVVPSSRRKNNPQYSRNEYNGGIVRGNQKIDVRGIQKFLPQKSGNNSKDSKDDKGRNSTKGGFEIGSTTSLSTNPGQERKPHNNQRRRFERKESNATTHSTTAPPEFEKQSSVDKKSPPPRPEPIDVPSAPLSTANSSVDTPSVSTPTTNDAPTNSADNPTLASKSKKPKSNKKKKNSNAAPTGIFGALEEIRD